MSTSNPTRASNQVLVRLPNDLAERLATLVPARSRSRFLIELLRRELERESHGSQPMGRIRTCHRETDDFDQLLTRSRDRNKPKPGPA